MREFARSFMIKVLKILCIFALILSVHWEKWGKLCNSKRYFVRKTGSISIYKALWLLCVAQNSTLWPDIVLTFLVYLHKTVPINSPPKKKIKFLVLQLSCFCEAWAKNLRKIKANSRVNLRDSFSATTIFWEIMCSRNFGKVTDVTTIFLLFKYKFWKI